VPAGPAGQAPDEGLQAAIRRWRLQRQLRRADLREIEVTARENLRGFKRNTGDEPGPPAGMF
jgi:hypothetical protein